MEMLETQLARILHQKTVKKPPLETVLDGKAGKRSISLKLQIGIADGEKLKIGRC
jgi:hypothetical protein